MQTETILILLFSVAVAVAIAVRQLHVPYTVALVLTGLALGILKLFTPSHLTKELLFSVFLPGLLFEAAFHIEFRVPQMKLRRDKENGTTTTEFSMIRIS